MIEEVKKILDSMFFGDDPDLLKNRDAMAEEICQLFEPKPDESRLLTFDEWLCEEADNIPFHELSPFVQAKAKAGYQYDKTHRLPRQDAKTASILKAQEQQGVEGIFSELIRRLWYLHATVKGEDAKGIRKFIEGVKALKKKEGIE